jgi:hypothetical protein
MISLRSWTVTIFGLALVCVAGAPGTLAPAATAQASATRQANPTAQAAGAPQTPPPTEAELQALGDRIIAAVHKNDAALDEYERVERHTITSGAERRVTEDKTYRIVPTGTGVLHLLIKDGGKPVDAETYRKQLNDWKQVLEIANNPKDPREQAVYAKWKRKMKERSDLVDAARKAFTATWGGRETQNGRMTDVLILEPNPSFEPHTISETVLTHARVKIWVDDASGNIVHGEAEIMRDVYFGGGILGKLYRGARFSLDNTEVDRGIWAPARIQYNISGRKFLFLFETQEVTETSKYRRIGPPSQALALVTNELAHGAVVDP